MKYVGIAYGLLQLAFIVAKFTGHVHYAWPWVLAPLWIPIVVVVIVAILALALLGTSKGNPFQ